MKRNIFLIFATLLIAGSMKAQEQPTHYPFNYHDFPNTMTAIIQVQINGVEQTSGDLELGAFNGETITGAKRIGVYGSAGYHRVYLTIYGQSNYLVTFKLYNHQTGEELDNCMITYQGDPYIFNWISDTGIGSNKKPIVINFVTGPTFTKEINGYGNGSGNWYFIASPVDNANPAEVDGMTTGDFDLYWFDQTQALEWRNYKQGDGFNLVSGKGYLYANKMGGTLTFTGTPVEGDTYTVSLVKNDTVNFAGWNLVGNPFTETAYFAESRDFYVMNSARTGIMPATAPGIPPMEGAFVVAAVDGEELVFTKTSNSKGAMIALNISEQQSVIDRAIVRFDKGGQLPKFQFGSNSAKVCIPIEGQEFAVVRSEGIGEIPLSFKAEKNGSYTLSFTTEGVDLNYLHLVDNKTGEDVDLLVTPVYSFEAKPSDYASRFKLVFVAHSVDPNAANDFAFFSRGKLIVNNQGNAVLQILDLKGRVLKSETINGCADITVNVAPGVYMLRLVNGDDIKTQKIVME